MGTQQVFVVTVFLGGGAAGIVKEHFIFFTEAEAEDFCFRYNEDHKWSSAGVSPGTIYK